MPPGRHQPPLGKKLENARHPPGFGLGVNGKISCFGTGWSAKFLGATDGMIMVLGKKQGETTEPEPVRGPGR